MRSLTTWAVLALPWVGAVLADGLGASKVDAIYASAQEAFHDLLSALPEESLQAALSGLEDFQHGVFESHHHGVEHVHDNNPALATKLIVAAVRDLQKRQAPANGTTTAQSSAPPSAPSTQAQLDTSQPQQSTQPPPPASSDAAPAPPTTSTTARAVVVPVENTITTGGRTVVQTTEVLSEVTASVAVTIVRTDNQGSTVTQTETRPAVIQTTTDAAGRTQLTTAAGHLAPTAGEVMTATNHQGSTFLTTYTPAPGRVSSIKLLTTTDDAGQPRTLTSYAFVEPAMPTQTTSSPDHTQSTKPGLQSGAAARVVAMRYAAVGVLALLV